MVRTLGERSARRSCAIDRAPHLRRRADGISDAADGCAAHAVASKKALGEDDRREIPRTIAREYPKAVAACACKNVDVDAYELFTIASLALTARMVAEGWLELRIAAPGATTTNSITATTSGDLAHALAALPREDRRAGVVVAPAADSADRCARP